MTDLLPAYPIGQSLTCRLLHRGLNDTYLVTTADTRYVLRVYRHQWRTRDDIGYELDLLMHLQRTGAPVSSPVPRTDGSFTSLLHAPEGDRYAVLFTYAPGTPQAFPLADWYVRLYGQRMAEIHTGLDDFASPHPRFALDLDYLVDRPLRALLPLLAQRSDDQHYLAHLGGSLKAQVTLRSSELEHGRLPWRPPRAELSPRRSAADLLRLRLLRSWVAGLRPGDVPLERQAERHA